MSKEGSATAVRGDVADYVALFEALADETRLRLIARLGDGNARSIAELSAGAGITRQAVRKHLSTLERVRMVHSVARGRETRFAYNPQPMMTIQAFLETVSQQWDERLERLKAFVET